MHTPKRSHTRSALPHKLLAVMLGCLLMFVWGCPPPPNNNGNTNDNSTTNTNDNGGTDNANDNGSTDGNDNADDGNDNADDGNDNADDGGNDNSDDGSDDNDNSDDDSNDNADDGNDNADDGNDNGSDGGNDNDNSDDGSNDNGDDGDTGGDPDPPASVSIENIVQIGDPVPDQPNAEFTAFGTPVIDAAGRVAFWAHWDGANGNGGLYVYDDGELLRVVDDDDANAGTVPDGDNDDYFGTYRPTDGNPLENSVVWGKDGRLLFVSRVRNDVGTVDVFRWRASDGDMIKVTGQAEMADLFPDTYDEGRAFTANYDLTGVSDNGIVAFTVAYSYFKDPSNQLVSGRGVFKSNGVETTFLADINLSDPGDVPGQADSSSARFVTFELLAALNRGGDIIYQGRYASGVGNGGVYLGRGGTNYWVLDNRSDGDFEGLPNNAQVGPDSGIYEAFSTSQQSIVVDTELDVSGNTRDAVLLWDWDDTRWYEIVGPSGVSASVLLSGVNDSGQVLVLINDEPYIAAAGTTSLRVSGSLPSEFVGYDVLWAEDSGAINNHGRALLHYILDPSTDAGVGLAYWTGEDLLVVADALSSEPWNDIIEIHTLAEPQRDHPGRSGNLTDTDRFTFLLIGAGDDGQADTDDDFEAIFLGVAD